MTKKPNNHAPMSITHADLVQRAVRWLLNTKGCTIAFSEMSTGNLEYPDAIGFQGRTSIVVECKTSRADYLRDKHKAFRRLSPMGMGQCRYYMVPEDMIDVGELPARWGLLYLCGRHVRLIQIPSGFSQRNRQGETLYLVSMLRRIKLRVGNTNARTDVLNQWLKNNL